VGDILQKAGGDMGSKVDLGACVTYGVDALKKNIGFQLVAVIVLALANGFTAGILGGPLLLGYYRALAKMDAGQTPDINDLFSGFDKFIPAFLVVLLTGVLIAIGYFLCIVPGLIIAPLLPVSLCVIARGEGDAIAAIKAGWNALQPNIVMAALTGIILSIISSLGVLACGVGILFTLPIALAGTYKLSQQMLGETAPAEPADAK
jgi:hypothetical protein